METPATIFTKSNLNYWTYSLLIVSFYIPTCVRTQLWCTKRLNYGESIGTIILLSFYTASCSYVYDGGERIYEMIFFSLCPGAHSEVDKRTISASIVTGVVFYFFYVYLLIRVMWNKIF